MWTGLSPADSEARQFKAVKAVHSVSYIDSCQAGKQVCPAKELRRVCLATETDYFIRFRIIGWILFFMTLRIPTGSSPFEKVRPSLFEMTLQIFSISVSVNLDPLHVQN